MPLGSLLCALWAACVAGRRNCSVGFWSAGTSPSPTHLWSPRFHTRARGAGLPQFVVMCRPWLQAVHACTIRGLCLGVVVVCRSDRPSTCQTSTAQPYMQCLLVATFFCRLHLRCIAWSVLVSTCSCMQHLLVHIFLGHAVDMHGGGSVLFSCLKTRRLRNSMSWSVQMLHFVLCAALSQLSTELTAEGTSCRCTSYCSNMVGCKLWSVVLIRCGVLFGLGLVPGRQQHVVHAVLQSPLCSVLCLFVCLCRGVPTYRLGIAA